LACFAEQRPAEAYAEQYMATYRAVQLKGKGALDQLQEVEMLLEPPKHGEIRIRVRASGAGFTDISKRTGYYPYRPEFPFVEGYEVVGDVDAIGPGVAVSHSGNASAR
jgi:NADPH:quinone reductase-like Zn-dependent oxidoreductase